MAKELLFYGKTAEELKKMDMKDVMKFLPSRARRSLVRTQGLKKHEALKKKIDATILGKRKKPIKTHCREFIILPNMIGLVIKVYNGKEFQDVNIIEPMVGHYLGEFALTRKPGAHSGPGIGATKSSKGAKK